MTDKELLERITCHSSSMLGKPVIKGTRLTVGYLLNLLAHGATVDEIVAEYQGLKPEDVHAALLFASRSLCQACFVSGLEESWSERGMNLHAGIDDL